ncbi:MAG: YfcE family phosphodiesterase [Coriobacteriia bacterium]|nr:YfcE family phosphodiesterase [Coriobacteriia bacterium]
MSPAAALRVGVLSDTHDLLRPEVEAALSGVDAIVHAGDVGVGSILDALEAIAPVTAVRGNCDVDGRAGALPSLLNTAIGGVRFLVTHRRVDLPPILPPDVRVVVTGHSHRYHSQVADGVLALNPGSASQNRGHGRSLAIVTIAGDGSVSVTRIDLP